MNIRRFVITIAVGLFSAKAASINHDEVEPFAQPDPVTISEKAALKFKPRLRIDAGCTPFPAVNAAGEISGGLKGSGGAEGCEISLLGSQVYGRAGWYNDVWAIMYAWYFPKGFWDATPFWRHHWSSAVVWIDNPELETPRVLGLSLSTSNTKYDTQTSTSFINGTTPVLVHYTPSLSSAALMAIGVTAGEFQDLIMWEQLTDAARSALNNNDNFGRVDVPLSDENFPEWLEKAWLM